MAIEELSKKNSSLIIRVFAILLFCHFAKKNNHFQPILKFKHL